MLRAIGLPEMMVIGAVFVLLFGGSKLKSLGTGLGESIREFRKTYKDLDDTAKEVKKL